MSASDPTAVSGEMAMEDDFCSNMGMNMVMYMQGFQLSTQSKTLPCLNYYFRTWNLSDAGKFKGAMLFSFMLALLTQGLSAVRAAVVRHVKEQKRLRKTLLVLIFTLQQLLGYLIMLIAMMFSIELILAVVVGIALGHRLFVRDETRRPRRRQQRSDLEVPLLEDVQLQNNEPDVLGESS